MRLLAIAATTLACAGLACSSGSEPAPVYETGRADDPGFCVTTEADGRKYTSNDAYPTAVQQAAGVRQGEYPYPVVCSYSAP